MVELYRCMSYRCCKLSVNITVSNRLPWWKPSRDKQTKFLKYKNIKKEKKMEKKKNLFLLLECSMM